MEVRGHTRQDEHRNCLNAGRQYRDDRVAASYDEHCDYGPESTRFE